MKVRIKKIDYSDPENQMVEQNRIEMLLLIAKASLKEWEAERGIDLFKKWKEESSAAKKRIAKKTKQINEQYLKQAGE